MKWIYCVIVASGLVLSASGATTAQPKVVFIGDFPTYLWTDAFTANPNWINKGADGAGAYGNGELVAQTAARFQSDVVALHPDIVHIMVGANDEVPPQGTDISAVAPTVAIYVDQMVKEAKAANIQVILGIEPEFEGQGTAFVNSWLQSYGAAHNITVVNYGDAICECVTEWGDYGVNTYSAYYFGMSNDTRDQGAEALGPNIRGYALMTQMAETAINTTNLTLRSGWLQDVQLSDPDLGLYPPGPSNVNSVATSAYVQFQPIGKYSDGSDHVLNNSNSLGSNIFGAWSSSDPLVMAIDQQGLAFATTAGTATIRFTPYNGVTFHEWIMYVTESQGVPQQRVQLPEGGGTK